MDRRLRLSVVLATIILGGASVGVSPATAASQWPAGVEMVAADKKEQTPAQPSAIGDELIYDILGPNVSESPKPRAPDKRSHAAGHLQLELDGKP